MGNCIARILRRRKIKRHIVLILIGLDNAGKTKTVHNLAGEANSDVVPTVGFKAVNLVHKSTPVTIYDLGGGTSFRQIWCQYYSEVHGVIFVIDSSDFARLDECKEVLEEVISHDRISGKPILVLANKQDKAGALDDIDVVEKLNIEPLVNKYRCPTLVESYSASVNVKNKKEQIDPGLKKGYQWLLNYIVRRYDDINLRVQTDIHAELERRRIQSKAHRASQTFTAASDEITTQTGFDNPTYDNFTKNSTPIKQNGQECGVIIVKPIRHENSSRNTTVTIESREDSGNTSLPRPKLSPFFGKESDNSTITDGGKIELDVRSEFRKLSPIVRNLGPVNGFQSRSDSCSSKKSEDEVVVSKNTSQISQNDTSQINQNGATHMSQNGASQSSQNGGSQRSANVTEVCLGDSWDKRPVLLNEAEVNGDNKEVFHLDRSISKSPSTLPAPARPATTSQLVRRQLELTATTHKRRLSLRYLHRAKTSPEPEAVSGSKHDKGAQLFASERPNSVIAVDKRPNIKMDASV